MPWPRLAVDGTRVRVTGPPRFPWTSGGAVVARFPALRRPLGQKVKLTVVHDDLEPGSTVLELISGGWPAILSDLKTLLEARVLNTVGPQEPSAAGGP